MAEQGRYAHKEECWTRQKKGVPDTAQIKQNAGYGIKIRPETVKKERIVEIMTKNNTLTEEQKKLLLQAKHRLEEAQTRDREKERKARTRRLIQEGAVLETVLPEAEEMTLEQLEGFLKVHLQRHF